VRSKTQKKNYPLNETTNEGKKRKKVDILTLEI